LTVTYPPEFQQPSTLEEWMTLSVLVHAGAKVGKSTLAATAPKPILALDAEGSWKFLPVRKKWWDPMREWPPTYDGTWDVCIVTVREWAPVERVFQWLTQYQTPFVSVVLDSITEIQRRCKANLKGSEAMKIQDWDTLLRAMDGVIRGYRDLTITSGLNVRCAVFIAETREINGKWRPHMQGQIAVALPYWTDIVGYLYPAFLQDQNGQNTQEVRQLLVTPHPQYEAGERVQGRLGQAVTIPRPADGQIGSDIERMIQTVYAQPWAQDAQTAQRSAS
jgi:hypothetical protein